MIAVEHDDVVRMRVRAHMTNDTKLKHKYHDSVEEMLRAVLKKEPEHPCAQDHLGSTLMTEFNDIDGAIVAFEKAIAKNPRHALAHYNLGCAFYKKGNINKAVEQFRRACTIHPMFGVAQQDLGEALAMMGKTDDAISNYKKVLSINPKSVVAHFSLGKAYRKKGNHKKAEEWFGRAFVINPDCKCAQPPSSNHLLATTF
jgi:tetratricopeptide (TPR) repeat protein